MKVYVITHGDYSDYRIVTIFISKKKAKEFMKIITDCRLEVYETDSSDILSEVNKGRVLYRVVMDYDGTMEVCELDEVSYCNYTGSLRIWPRTQAPVYKRKKVNDAIMGTVWATNELHAAKIANEFRVQRIAENKLKSWSQK